MAIYVVGDIQGCYTPLRRLLDKVKFNPKNDVLWCVGDLVNRGSDSLKTLRFLKALGDACVCVLGNHDFHLLEKAAGGRDYPRDTLTQVLDAPDADELLAWVRTRPLLHHDKKKIGAWYMQVCIHIGHSLKPNNVPKLLKQCCVANTGNRFVSNCNRQGFQSYNPNPSKITLSSPSLF